MTIPVNVTGNRVCRINTRIQGRVLLPKKDCVAFMSGFCFPVNLTRIQGSVLLPKKDCVAFMSGLLPCQFQRSRSFVFPTWAPQGSSFKCKNLTSSRLKMCSSSTTVPLTSTTPAGVSSTFLGTHIEICLVTRDHKKAIEGLLRLGIGPWKTYTFTPENTTHQTFRGDPSPFTMKVCFAEPPGSVVWEIIQPVSGSSIFEEFLEKKGEGIHHVAYDCNKLPWEERIAKFEEKGFKMVQGGRWMGRNKFAFFETDGATGTCFETIEFPDDWEFPPPDEEYPLLTSGNPAA